MKALESCCNGDGRPIQPPSKVLCKECLGGLNEQFIKLAEGLGMTDVAAGLRKRADHD